jgi:hypothetical protein
VNQGFSTGITSLPGSGAVPWSSKSKPTPRFPYKHHVRTARQRKKMDLNRITSFTNRLPSWVGPLAEGILAFELFLGGVPRITGRWPVPARLHQSLITKTQKNSKAIQALLPIEDVGRQRIVAGWLMCFTGALLMSTQTRGSIFTLLMVLYLTGVGMYSQRVVGDSYRLPVMNATLGIFIYIYERNKAK